jgi:hypothetical protein
MILVERFADRGNCSDGTFDRAHEGFRISDPDRDCV